MQGVFEMIDAGAYDAWLLGIMGTIFALSFVWQRSIRRSAGRRFRAEQARAQELWARLGPDHQSTQIAVVEALTTWGIWQGRSPLSLNPEKPGTSGADWEAISLMKSVPEESFSQS